MPEVPKGARVDTKGRCYPPGTRGRKRFFEHLTYECMLLADATEQLIVLGPTVSAIRIRLRNEGRISRQQAEILQRYNAYMEANITHNRA